MGVDKGLMDFNGQPLIQYSIELLELFCNDIIISANNKEYERFGYPVLPDKISGLGPAEGISTAIREAKNEWSIIISCDVPFVTPSIINRLSAGINNCDAVVPKHDSGVEPLIAIYNKKFLTTFEESLKQGIMKMQDILSRGKVCYVNFQDVLDVDSQLFNNINSLSDI
jgi:molybdopterin-guanine dinucleotide biosynthesis protein A